MALPKLKKIVYPIHFSSIKKDTTFRPFSVAEEKILMHIKGSTDKKFIAANLKNLINNCINETIDIDRLAMYDIEYFLVQVRARSVGEIIELQHTDKVTGKVSKATINLEDVKVVIPENRVFKIEITDEIGLIMKDPEFATVLASQDDGVDQQESIWNIILASIKAIYDKDTLFTIGVDATLEEVEAFVDDLPTTASAKLYQFFNEMPYVEAIAKLEDGTEFPIKGITNFLAL